jgi:hypothetical protein
MSWVCSDGSGGCVDVRKLEEIEREFCLWLLSSEMTIPRPCDGANGPRCIQFRHGRT